MSLIRYTSLPISDLQQQINRMFDDFFIVAPRRLKVWAEAPSLQRWT